MRTIKYNGNNYNCHEDETVLDAFLRQAVDVQFSCRNGTCQVCLQKCVKGSIPEAANKTLRESLRSKGYFLPCKCKPEENIEIQSPDPADLYSRAIIVEKSLLAPDICRLLLESTCEVYYHAGQFINLRREDGLTRSYSLASLPQDDYYLEVHVKRMQGGAMSNWIFDQLQEGDEIEIQGPQGSCFYILDELDQNILLIGTGTGLAPLIGIIRDALKNGHYGNIYLYHGSRYKTGLYLQNEITELTGQYKNFFYYTSLSGEKCNNHLYGRAHDIAFDIHKDLKNWRIYLCGEPGMVEAGQELALMNGANKLQIHTDSFQLLDKRNLHERKRPEPDLVMWEEGFEQGKLLQAALEDFYRRVYKDHRLSPFFKNTTIERSIEKQFSFIKSLVTGENVYFGDRPRNAHHWMVISDELFDYREDLLEKVMLEHGIPEKYVRRLRAIDEAFRSDIVKSAPWQRYLNGELMPLDGYKEEILTEGSICDSCGCEIQAGELVRYHVRLGHVYCKNCTEKVTSDSSI